MQWYYAQNEQNIYACVRSEASASADKNNTRIVWHKSLLFKGTFGNYVTS